MSSGSSSSSGSGEHRPSVVASRDNSEFFDTPSRHTPANTRQPSAVNVLKKEASIKENDKTPQSTDPSQKDEMLTVYDLSTDNLGGEPLETMAEPNAPRFESETSDQSYNTAPQTRNVTLLRNLGGIQSSDSMGASSSMNPEQNKPDQPIQSQPKSMAMELKENNLQVVSTSSLSKEQPKSDTSLNAKPPAQVYEMGINVPQTPFMETYKYPSNYVVTSKYSLWTFLPINIYEQFRRFYNFYFLLSAVLGLIPGTSTISPVSLVFPLVLVLLVTAVKDGIEDLRRHKADARANAALFDVVRKDEILKLQSRDINVGDILTVKKGAKCPADIIVMATSWEDGTAYVETSELDGETNLKRKTAVSETAKLEKPSNLANLLLHIECEMPNERLNNYEGKLHIYPSPSAGFNEHLEIPLTPNQLILRGSFIRNVEWVHGLVVYAGVDTKVFRNLKKPKLKQSALEKKVNNLMLFAFGFNAVIWVVSIVYGINWSNTNLYSSGTSYWYLLPMTAAQSTTSLYSAFNFFILFTYTIPISLFVTMEIVRLYQALLMYWDDDMAAVKPIQAPSPTSDPNSPSSDLAYPVGSLDSLTGASDDTMRCRVNNSNLNEELAQVDYIFSDKTGTLTRNIMKISKWYIWDQEFDERLQRGGIRMLLNNPEITVEKKAKAQMFLNLIGLCHTVIPGRNETTGKILYEAQSPDESALLQGLKRNGILVTSRTKSSITLEENGQSKQYELLDTLDFTSDRKRMSVILRDPFDSNSILLFVKGADNMILDRLDKTLFPANSTIVTRALSKLGDFSQVGLRTLMVAWRKIPEKEYKKFKEDYEQAQRSLTDREAKIADACEKIEVNLEFLGCTAIEDKLQDKVGETLSFILDCDIKLWMLTGDKQETAINIAMSSCLFRPNMNMMILNSTNGRGCKKLLTDFNKSVLDRKQAKESTMNGLVVNGATLVFVLADYTQEFLDLVVHCHAVVACRMTPLQKAQIVQLVKMRLKKLTLAIGDGANDVTMIQAANIGVGVAGQEGAQATRAADYAIKEFKSLRLLLAVHGRWNYRRLATLVTFSMYKNISFITVQFLFGIVNAWSGQNLYQDTILALYNVIYTSLPPLIFAMFEKDVSASIILDNPKLYPEIRRGPFFNPLSIAAIFFEAMWHAVVMYGGLLYFEKEGIYSGSSGRALGYWVQSLLSCAVVITTVLLRMFLTFRSLNLWSWLSLLVSMVIFTVSIFVIDSLSFIPESGTSTLLYQCLSIYFLLAIIPVVANLPLFIFSYCRRLFKPYDFEILLEEEYARKHLRQNATAEDPPQITKAAP